MKTPFATVKQCSATLLAALLLGAGAASSQAALAFPPSPVFSNAVPAWDCLITGANGERGIMFLTFTYNPDGYGNYSFNLKQIHTKVPVVTAKPPVPLPPITPAPDPRGGAGSGRGDVPVTVVPAASSGNVVATTAGTNIFGYLATTGSWGYDYSGNILGFYIEKILVKPAEGTNPPVVLTNQVSFIGRATPNKRLTALYSSSIGGNGKYSGVPQKTVTNKINGSDFRGHWTGTEIINQRTSVELFTMANTGTNAYDIIGDGPGYTLDWQPFGVGPFPSKCLISSQNRIAFSNYKFAYPTNAVYTLRSTYGVLNNSSLVAGTKSVGLLAPGSNVVYNAYFVPFAPYP